MIQAVVASLLNAAWQSIVLFGAVWLGVRAARRSSAATRYAIWSAALIVAVALPGIDNLVAASRAANPAPAPRRAVEPAPVADGQHFSIAATSAAHSTVPVHTYRTTHEPQALVASFKVTEVKPNFVAAIRSTAASLFDAIAAFAAEHAGAILTAWLALGGLLLARLLLAYTRLLGIKRTLFPLRDERLLEMTSAPPRPVMIGTSSEVEMPCLLGFRRPAIALPRDLVAALAPADLTRIIRHEQAHARRWDDVANAAQQVAKAIFWFNPAVHLICRMLDVEREIACDDHAVVPLDERVQYAKCLAHLAVDAFERGRALPAPCLFFNRKQLLVRVERLLERGHNGTTSIARTARFSVAIFAVAAVVVARFQLPVIAAAPSAPSAPIAPRIATQISAHAAVAAVRAVAARVAAQNAQIPAIRVMATVNVRHLAPALHAMDLTVAVMAKRMAIVPRRTMLVDVATRANTAVASAIANARAAAMVASAPSDSDGELLDALSKAGYPPLSVDDLIRLKDVGVTGGLISAAVAYNGSRPSVDSLTRLASVGVDGAYLRSLPNLGITHLDLDAVIRLKSLGVDPSYIRNMDAALKTHATSDDLARLASVGVDASYVRDIDSALGADAAPEDIIRMRSVGMDPGYVRDVDAALNARPSLDDLVRLRSMGIQAAYIRDMDSALGERLSVDDLVRLMSVGVDAEFVRTLHSKGIGVNHQLSVDDLIRLRSAGI